MKLRTTSKAIHMLQFTKQLNEQANNNFTKIFTSKLHSDLCIVLFFVENKN